MKARALFVVAAVGFAGLVLGGCDTASGSAIRTGPLRLPPNLGPISLYATEIPIGARELGIVEAHAYGEEGVVENLLPIVAQKTAQLGGNAVVIDSVRADFRIVERPIVESYSYPCGWRTCVGTRVIPAAEEVMIVTMQGRALSVTEHP
ncbi:MAG: hypothetical protein ABI183_21945 [Polyangiaceae bacterium]